MTVEVLTAQPATDRAHYALLAFSRAAKARGLRLDPTTAYAGRAPWLLFWGPGAPDRADAMRRQVVAGGRAIALDLAYWNRNLKVRVSVDAPHPQALVLARDWPGSRLKADKPVVRDAWDPAGPVVIAGIGVKAQAQYGAQVDAWQSAQVDAIQAAGRRAVLRPKPRGSAPPIEQVLAGASALVTWHSNVAVDAIRLGIPAVCRDGAAAAVCPAAYAPGLQPLAPALRDRFLYNLAWFQWNPATEAAAFWAFLQELLA